MPSEGVLCCAADRPCAPRASEHSTWGPGTKSEGRVAPCLSTGSVCPSPRAWAAREPARRTTSTWLCSGPPRARKVVAGEGQGPLPVAGSLAPGGGGPGAEGLNLGDRLRQGLGPEGEGWAHVGKAGSGLWALGIEPSWGGLSLCPEKAHYPAGRTWLGPGENSPLRCLGSVCGDGAGWDLCALGSGSGCACQPWTLPSLSGDNGGIEQWAPGLASCSPPCLDGAGWAWARGLCQSGGALGLCDWVCVTGSVWWSPPGLIQAPGDLACLSQMSGTVCRRKPSPSGLTSTSSRWVSACVHLAGREARRRRGRRVPAPGKPELSDLPEGAPPLPSGSRRPGSSPFISNL